LLNATQKNTAPPLAKASIKNNLLFAIPNLHVTSWAAPDHNPGVVLTVSQFRDPEIKSLCLRGLNEIQDNRGTLSEFANGLKKKK
jgi:hypothetical protein